DGTTFGDQNTPCDLAPWVYVGAQGVGSNDNAINLAKGTFVAGHFLTLDGKIALGNGNTLYGTFWGKDIISDFNDNVTDCRPIIPPTPTPTPTSTWTPTSTPTAAATASSTPTPTAAASSTSTPTSMPTECATASATPTGIATASATSTGAPTASA